MISSLFGLSFLWRSDQQWGVKKVPHIDGFPPDSARQTAYVK